MLNLFGLLAFVTSVIGLLPQLIKSLKTRSTRDLSLWMLLNYALCSFSWIMYAIYSHSAYVFWSNVLGILSSLALLFLKWKHES